uniref:Uncharacterized protein n=1 Tax=Panagrellus redivivus TaxID=6233 RepID=A0A7E4V7U7_PANRE
MRETVDASGPYGSTVAEAAYEPDMLSSEAIDQTWRRLVISSHISAMIKLSRQTLCLVGFVASGDGSASATTGQPSSRESVWCHAVMGYEQDMLMG